MKKLNGFESYLVIEGLNAMRVAMKNDIEKAELNGRRSLMTTGFVDVSIDETIAKIKALTLKDKHNN